MHKSRKYNGTVSAFASDVYDAVRKIPCGKVATYSQIAALSGHAGATRAVGGALHSNPLPGVVPCHRVVNACGALASGFAFGGPDGQKRLLEADGVEVHGGTVDLDMYMWRDNVPGTPAETCEK